MFRSSSIAIAILACFAFPYPYPVLCAGPYNATWASLDTRPVPTWYEDAKFGIFIHWGVYSVPAFGDVGRQYAEWYWHDLVGNPNGIVAAFHNKTYGPHFKYTQFTDSFKAELFDASQWADLIKRSGAKYVVPTSKHHEGFTLWPSTQSWNWNAKDVGPHRDLLNEIMTAVRAAGLHAGLYFSLYEWFHPMYIGPNPKDYVTQVMDPQWRDLISNYRPDLLWCDGAWEKSSDFWESKEFLAWVYNESPVADRIIVNDRFGNDTQGKHGGFYTAEYQPNVWLDHKWEENSGVDVFSYGYNRATPEDKYFTTESLVQLLVRCVSNNGNFLLDIGPDADGTIPTVEQQRLLEIGEWLQQNGEGIYGSRVWRVQQDGTLDATNVRYTYQPTTKIVYAFVLTWPDSGQVVLQAPIPTSNTTVTFLGLNTQLTYKPLNNDQQQEKEQKHAQPGLSVTFPSYNPSKNLVKYVWCLKLENVM